MFRVEIEQGWGSKLLVSCWIVNSPQVLISSLMPLIGKIFSIDTHIEHSKRFEFEQVALLWVLYLLLVRATPLIKVGRGGVGKKRGVRGGPRSRNRGTDIRMVGGKSQ